MGKLPKFNDPMLLVGTETSDDAAVYQVSPDLALIQTVDFFTPVVDDPYTFGQIAAANALSDVYAMGGEPRLALNIAAFPNCLSPEILGDILAGGADKVKEAGAVLAGGHTIQDEEPKYGLSVTGFVHPKRLWKNHGAEKGDLLILTKPLGIGVLNTAVKAGLASVHETEEAVRVMSYLNKYALEAVRMLEIHACTDVTGFGLAGHVLEMAKASHKTLTIHAGRLPVIEGALEYASMGLVPEGAYRNREYAQVKTVPELAGTPLEDIVYDPQTSGGLIFALPSGDAEQALKNLSALDVPCAVIGEVQEEEEYNVLLDEK